VVLWNVNIIIDNVLESNVGPTGRNGMFKVKNKIIFILLAFMSIVCSAANNTSVISDSDSNDPLPLFMWPQGPNSNDLTPAFPVENGNSESSSWWNPSEEDSLNILKPVTPKATVENYFPDNYESDLIPNYAAIKDRLEKESLNSANNKGQQEIIDLIKKAAVNENWTKPRTCPWRGCNERCPCPKTMWEHLKKHAKTIQKDVNEKYTCGICLQIIKKKYYYTHLRSHINYHYYLCGDPAFNETTCVRRFGTSLNRRIHQANHNMATQQCLHCDSFFKSNVWANKHCLWANKHGQKRKRALNKPNVSPSASAIRNVGKFECNYIIEKDGSDCPKWFATQAELDDHINVAHLSEPNPYPTTPRKINSSNLNVSPNASANRYIEEFQCKYIIEENGNDCQKNFATKAELDNHIDDFHFHKPHVSQNSARPTLATGNNGKPLLSLGSSENVVPPVINLSNTNSDGIFSSSDKDHQVINTHKKAPTTTIEDWPKPRTCRWPGCNELSISPKAMGKHLVAHEKITKRNGSESGEFKFNYVIDEDGSDCPKRFATPAELNNHIEDDHMNVAQLSEPTISPNSAKSTLATGNNGESLLSLDSSENVAFPVINLTNTFPYYSYSQKKFKCNYLKNNHTGEICGKKFAPEDDYFSHVKTAHFNKSTLATDNNGNPLLSLGSSEDVAPPVPTISLFDTNSDDVFSSVAAICVTRNRKILQLEPEPKILDSVNVTSPPVINLSNTNSDDVFSSVAAIHVTKKRKISTEKYPKQCTWKGNCNQMFETPREFWKHLCDHAKSIEKDENGKSICGLCGSLSKKYFNLKDHLRIKKHANFPKYQCTFVMENKERCQKRFFNPNNRKGHINSFHLRKKPYKCSNSKCQCSFADKNNLIRHIKSCLNKNKRTKKRKVSSRTHSTTKRRKKEQNQTLSATPV